MMFICILFLPFWVPIEAQFLLFKKLSNKYFKDWNVDTELRDLVGHGRVEFVIWAVLFGFGIAILPLTAIITLFLLPAMFVTRSH